MTWISSKFGFRKMFSNVVALVNSDASSILDLGCGPGFSTSMLAEKFPSGVVVGLDSSKYLLDRLRKEREKPNIFLVRGDVSTLPLKAGSFDAVVAIRILHEVLCSGGESALIKTLQKVYGLLHSDSELIILDPVSPGDTIITLGFSEELLKKLQEFKSKFKYREIAYEVSEGCLVRISMRDFYEFVTKIGSMNTEREEEEMLETHTPYTRQDLTHILEETGFKIVYSKNLMPINRIVKRYEIELHKDMELPDWYFLIRAVRI